MALNKYISDGELFEKLRKGDFSGIETEENVRFGSATPIARNTSVIFGDVYVQPI